MHTVGRTAARLAFAAVVLFACARPEQPPQYDLLIAGGLRDRR